MGGHAAWYVLATVNPFTLSNMSAASVSHSNIRMCDTGRIWDITCSGFEAGKQQVTAGVGQAEESEC